jgi:hypothetical protein
MRVAAADDARIFAHVYSVISTAFSWSVSFLHPPSLILRIAHSTTPPPPQRQPLPLPPPPAPSHHHCPASLLGRECTTAPRGSLPAVASFLLSLHLRFSFGGMSALSPLLLFARSRRGFRAFRLPLSHCVRAGRPGTEWIEVVSFRGPCRAKTHHTPHTQRTLRCLPHRSFPFPPLPLSTPNRLGSPQLVTTINACPSSCCQRLRGPCLRRMGSSCPIRASHCTRLGRPHTTCRRCPQSWWSCSA